MVLLNKMDCDIRDIRVWYSNQFLANGSFPTLTGCVALPCRGHYLSSILKQMQK